MAAALFRRGGALCCIHRVLWRVVWRPQTALYSSKSTDRIPPRKTHIKKAKPQPPLDVNKLVEKLYSLTRSDAAPPAGKARRAKASSSSSSSHKPPSTSSATSSTLPPSAAALSPASSLKQAHDLPISAAFSAAPSFPQPANQKTSEPHPQTVPQVSSAHIESDRTTSWTEDVSRTIETKADAAAAAAVEAFPAATVEPVTQTTVESPVESSFPPVEELATDATLTAGSVESAVEVPVGDSAVVELSVETTVESAVESSFPPVEELATDATLTAGSVESTVDVPVGDSAVPEVVVELSVETTVESPVESSFPLEEARPSVVEGTAEPSVDAKVDVETQEVGKDSSLTKDSIETLESTIEFSVPAEEALDTKGSVVEGPVDATVEIQTNDASTNAPELVLVNKAEPVMETTVETLEPRTTLMEDIVEPSIDATVNTQAVMDVSHIAKEEPLIKSQIESPEAETMDAEGPVEPAVDVVEVQSRSTEATIQVEQSTETAMESPIDANSSSEGALEASAAVEETAAERRNGADVSNTTEEEERLVDTIVEALGSEAVVPDRTTEFAIESSDGLSEANLVQNAPETSLGNETDVGEEEAREPEKMTLDSMTLHLVHDSVESLQSDELLRTVSQLDEGAAVVHVDEAETPTESEGDDGGETLTEVLAKWDSLSEELDGLEGESGTLMNELICSVPTAVSKSPAASDPPGDPAMTLESMTLAAAEEDFGSLDADVLEETSKSLEREAEEKAKEETMRAEATEEDAEVFADVTEPAAMTPDSLSEATDAIEAETEVMMEAMFGSEQGPKQPPDAKTQEARPREGTIAQNVESEEKGGAALEAMSVEAVTLAEVEAFLGSLENETLSETADYLEKEAEVGGGGGDEEEKKPEVEEGAGSPDVDALSLESLSEDLQTDALMEELLFTVPGPARVVPDLKTVPEETTEDVEEAGTDADLDPVQRLFVEKIREYNEMRRSRGGRLEAEPNYQKQLLEETAKLEKLYGGGNLENFPQFTFPEPKTDQDSK